MPLVFTLLSLTYLLELRDSAPAWNLHLHLHQAPSFLPLVILDLIALVVDLGLEAEL